jgi:MFS family permease
MLIAQGASPNTAAFQASILIAGFATGACVLGWLGDRTSRRWTLTAACAGAYACWSVLATGVAFGSAGLAPIFFMLGFFSGGFNLVYALVTARNPIDHAGTATAFINVGIFLGAGTMQSISSHFYALTGGNFTMVLAPMILASLATVLLSLSLTRRIGAVATQKA